MPATDSSRTTGIPSTEEYDPYYQTYVGNVDADRSVLTTLEHQSREVSQLLDRLTEDRSNFRYAPDKWSIKQVIGHLIDTERIFSFRGLAFARGDDQPIPGMDQDAWVDAAGFNDRSLRDLAHEYAAVRTSTLSQFSGFTGQQLERRGTASGCEFSCRATLFIIAGHERHHLQVLYERYGLGASDEVPGNGS